jgi:pimeloyl-ACP methyl ester carboxylesterase
VAADVVLVHGAWSGAWCWEPVVKRLAAQAITATAVDLEMCTVSGDAEVVREAVASARYDGAERVLLLGHSYGGLVISAGGHEADHLIYLAAMVPAPGETMLDASVTEQPTELAKGIVFDEKGTYMPTFEGSRDGMYQLCPPGVAEAAFERLRPVHIAVINEPIEDPAWKTVPSTYVVCAHDQSLAPERQRERAQWLQEQVVLDSDHSPFYSAPDDLAAVIAERAKRFA